MRSKDARGEVIYVIFLRNMFLFKAHMANFVNRILRRKENNNNDNKERVFELFLQFSIFIKLKIIFSKFA